MGKAYANRKKEEIRPENDFYPTPKGLTYELIKTGILNGCKTILEPCCGQYAISNVLLEKGFEVTNRDLIYGNDFLKDDYSSESYDALVTNPPFKIWDDIVKKAKSINVSKIILIGRLNYFGSHSRNISNLWDELSDIYVFDRQVAYNTEFREDGKMECGCLVTGWFVWTKEYRDSPRVHMIDVQKWIISKKEKNTLKNIPYERKCSSETDKVKGDNGFKFGMK